LSQVEIFVYVSKLSISRASQIDG